MYPGGREERAADIAAGRGASARMVMADLRRSVDALMEVWNSLPDDAWSATGRMVKGDRGRSSTRSTSAGARSRSITWTSASTTRRSTGRSRSWHRRSTTRWRRCRARGAPHRPNVQARYRIDATDHGRAWTRAHGARWPRGPRRDGRAGRRDAVVSGWGCDLLAWLYGRDAGRAGRVTIVGPRRRRAPAVDAGSRTRRLPPHEHDSTIVVPDVSPLRSDVRARAAPRRRRDHARARRPRRCVQPRLPVPEGHRDQAARNRPGPRAHAR